MGDARLDGDDLFTPGMGLNVLIPIAGIIALIIVVATYLITQ